MEDRAFELLALPDDVLFAHGGCHVFALVLSEVFSYPLMWICDEGGDHDHVACAPRTGSLLDVFGWFSYRDYVREEILGDRAIRFLPLGRRELQQKFIFGRGRGYYAHESFMSPAHERARSWISRHRDYFDRTRQTAIPGLRRVKRASDENGN